MPCARLRCDTHCSHDRLRKQIPLSNFAIHVRSQCSQSTPCEAVDIRSRCHKSAASILVFDRAQVYLSASLPLSRQFSLCCDRVGCADELCSGVPCTCSAWKLLMNFVRFQEVLHTLLRTMCVRNPPRVVCPSVCALQGCQIGCILARTLGVCLAAG